MISRSRSSLDGKPEGLLPPSPCIPGQREPGHPSHVTSLQPEPPIRHTESNFTLCPNLHVLNCNLLLPWDCQLPASPWLSPFVCLFSSSFFSSSDTVAKLGPRRRLHGLWGQRFAGVRACSAVPEPLMRNMVIPALGRSLSRHLLPLLKDGYLSSLELLT